MKNRVILLVVMMCGLLVGANTAYSQFDYCAAALGTCPPVLSRQITINVGTPTNPCMTNVFFCVACCNGIARIYFKEATWHPSGGCPSQWPIWSYLHRGSEEIQKKILAAMILDAGQALALLGNGCQTNLQLEPPCPDQSNLKWVLYRSTCAHMIQRISAVTGQTENVVEGCGSLDEWCNTQIYTCWNYSGPTPVLEVITISQQTEPGMGYIGCQYQPQPGVIELETCRVICP